MQHLLILAVDDAAESSAFSLDPLYQDTGLPLAAMGLLVVFAALILVRVFIGTLPRLMAILEHFFPEAEHPAHAAPAPEEASDEIPEHVVAIIAAVVTDMVGVRHRILRTRQLQSDDMSWALEGRLQHHASHRLQPKDRTN